MSNSTTSQQTSSNGFNFGTRLGMLFVVEASAASALAVSGVLLYIAYSAVTIQPNASRRWSTETHVHYYFLNLMICDLILAVGGLLNIKWIADASVHPDPLCTAQGVLKQVGDVGVALSTMAIALHILQVSASKKRCPPQVALGVVWTVTAALVIVPNAVQNGIYGPTGFWCWIDKGTLQEVALEYIWLWLAALLNAVAYAFLAVLIRRSKGKLRSKSPQYPGSFGYTLAVPPTDSRSEEHVRAFQMLFYPLVYIVVVLPISAARFSKFTGHEVPFAVIASADTLFALSGLINTLLYAFTRPQLIRRRPVRDTTSALLARATSARVTRDPFLPDFLDLKQEESRIAFQGPSHQSARL